MHSVFCVGQERPLFWRAVIVGVVIGAVFAMKVAKAQPPDQKPEKLRGDRKAVAELYQKRDWYSRDRSKKLTGKFVEIQKSGARGGNAIQPKIVLDESKQGRIVVSEDQLSKEDWTFLQRQLALEANKGWEDFLLLDRFKPGQGEKPILDQNERHRRMQLAWDWAKKSAEQAIAIGSLDGAEVYARMLANRGRYFVVDEKEGRQDQAKAVQLLAYGVRQKHISSMITFANFSRYGVGLPANPDGAVKLLEEAAKHAKTKEDLRRIEVLSLRWDREKQRARGAKTQRKKPRKPG